MTVLDEFEKLDRQRERWRAARRRLKLDDVNDPNFAMGGTAAQVKELSVRILILPADPQAHLFDIDDAFMAAWKTANIDPALEQEARWGYSTGATADGFVVYHDGRNVWNAYCGVCHSGAVDVGLGTVAAWTYQEMRAFNLLAIVGRVWAACSIQTQLAESLGIAGPLELSVALRQTAGAQLGGFAQGWSGDRYDMPQRAADSETNVVLRRELAGFDRDSARETAFSIGRQVENTFGTNLQRFRIIKNNVLGDFDAAKYSHS